MDDLKANEDFVDQLREVLENQRRISQAQFMETFTKGRDRSTNNKSVLSSTITKGEKMIRFRNNNKRPALSMNTTMVQLP